MSENDASRIIIDDSRMMLQIVAALNDDPRGIIYDCNMFIVQATGPSDTGQKSMEMPCKNECVNEP